MCATIKLCHFSLNACIKLNAIDLPNGLQGSESSNLREITASVRPIINLVDIVAVLIGDLV